MNVILFDDYQRNQLFPLTFTRPAADLRIGILSIREKWETYLDFTTSTLTVDYLREKYPLIIKKENLLINGAVFPDAQLIHEIKSLPYGHWLSHGKALIALKINDEILNKVILENLSLEQLDFPKVSYPAHPAKIDHVWDLFTKNAGAMEADMQLLTKGRHSASPGSGCQVIGDGVFIEKGAKVEHAILNSSKGPIYIGKETEVMEGSLIRGPFALCQGATVKMGAKIYGATTIGPYSKVGGEINNSIILGYSNKAHDGFLGNSIIGEWCNLGADTNNSNLKNTYGQVKAWNYAREDYMDTGQQFLGLVMGDHSKCGINTMFNTGTMVGVSANIFGAGFPPKFIPSFSWGGADGFSEYSLNKALGLAEIVMNRRNYKFHKVDKKIMEHIFRITAKYR